MIKTIKVACECDDLLALSDLVAFQGNLKIRDDSDFFKIKKSILDNGIIAPFFVWKSQGKNYVLDGHGRLEVLKKMKSNGWNIPSLPVVYIDCENEEKAKDLLLRMNSEYGTMTKQSVIDFIGTDFSLDVNDYSLSIGHIDLGLDKTLSYASENNENMDLSYEDENNNYIPQPVIEMPLNEAENSQHKTKEFFQQKGDSGEDQKNLMQSVYILKVNDFVYKAEPQEYLLFLNFVKDYAKKNRTLVGVINELFKKYSNNL